MILINIFPLRQDNRQAVRYKFSVLAKFVPTVQLKKGDSLFLDASTGNILVLLIKEWTPLLTVLVYAFHRKGSIYTVRYNTTVVFRQYKGSDCDRLYMERYMLLFQKFSRRFILYDVTNGKISNGIVMPNIGKFRNVALSIFKRKCVLSYYPLGSRTLLTKICRVLPNDNKKIILRVSNCVLVQLDEHPNTGHFGIDGDFFQYKVFPKRVVVLRYYRRLGYRLIPASLPIRSGLVAMQTFLNSKERLLILALYPGPSLIGLRLNCRPKNGIVPKPLPFTSLWITFNYPINTEKREYFKVTEDGTILYIVTSPEHLKHVNIYAEDQ